ncbi:hypothetical protein HUG17_6589 [Dermatophagoides farinae]|uniref:Nuclear cap-binding protein subunit 3 n=1 Tax=Dermatophagoides farinae TaxID=6954 RepID=A0A9D4SJG9_DERFA|nr:uncharacterized protein LOC124494124 [Dermatophagoides farinae]KAH7644227.1 hypothetical protein HUG17_6589 [Dermatophagoides farinae]
MDVDYQRELCLALNISMNELNKSFSNWRFNVLNVRGLDALTSEDVYEYFQRKPHSIEWLSNISCNVTFEGINEAFESLISIAKAIIIQKNEIDWRENSYGVKGVDNLNLNVDTADKLEIPVPPNFRYVMGEKHPKAKTILIRFATINDRKVNQQLPDTAPNERQQIIIAQRSSSTDPPSNVPLRRVKRTSNEIMMEIDEDIVNDSLAKRRRQRRSMPPIRMRMRADEEEERIRQQRQRQQRSSSDLRSRLSNVSFSSSRIGDRIQLQSVSSNRIMKAKRSDSIWRRTTDDDALKSRMRSIALDAKTGKKYTTTIGGNTRTVGDLRNKLNEPIIRVQVTYDDEEIDF